MPATAPGVMQPVGGVASHHLCSVRERPGRNRPSRATEEIEMSHTTRTRRPATLAAAVLATAVVSSGLAAGALSGPAVADEGVAAPATTVVDPNDAARALLRAGQMPVVNQEQDWARVATRHRRASSAQPTPLKALGFERKARRDFAIPGGQATNVVLTFADRAAARSAYGEVKGWRSHTGDNVPAGGRLLFTDKRRPVDVEVGRGSYFSFVFKTDKDADEGTFEWLGVTRRGDDLSIVVWRIDGQDATYEVDPTIASVQTANAKLARLG